LLAHESALIGQEVRDREGRSVGKLRDLVLDLDQGAVLGGLISSDDSWSLVPAECFSPASDQRIQLDTTKAQVLAEPKLAPETPVAGLTPNAVRAAFRQAGLAIPLWVADGQPRFQSAKALLAQPVVGQSGQPLGTVQDIILDVGFGKADYVVVRPAGGPGGSPLLAAVPPQALAQAAGAKGLVFKGDENLFLSGPRFQKQFWTDLATPAFASSVYRHYGLLAPSAAQPPTPTGRSEQAIEFAFLSELVDHAGIAAAHARNLNLQINGGRLTLSGQVPSGEDKAAILNAAVRAVGPANVIDRIQVR
jgi:sporulation protein YlmC with PRC-barrel domain